jgi:hypothetical protein
MFARLSSLCLGLLLLYPCGNAQPANKKAVVVLGQLFKANGRALPHTEIELVPVGSSKQVFDPSLNTISNSADRFSFSNVPPGKYTLSINFNEKPTDLSPYETHFYPGTPDRGQAQTFEIGASSKITGLIFKLPPALVAKPVVGRVVNSEGKPVTGAWIGLWDIKQGERLDYGSIKSGKDGKFSILGFEGRIYQVGAIQFDRIPLTPFDPIGNVIAAGETEVFKLERTASAIEVRVKSSNDTKTVLEKYVGMVERY